MGKKLVLTLNEVSQIAHSLAGCLAILGTQALFGAAWVWPAAGIGVAAAAFKEFYWDVHHESVQTAGSGAEDFAFYLVGLAVGLLAHYIKVWV